MSLLFWECVRRRFFTWMRKEIFFCIIQMIGDLFGISEFPVFGKEISPTQNTPHNQFSLEENDCIKFNRSFYDGIWSLETSNISSTSRYTYYARSFVEVFAINIAKTLLSFTCLMPCFYFTYTEHKKLLPQFALWGMRGMVRAKYTNYAALDMKIIAGNFRL